MKEQKSKCAKCGISYDDPTVKLHRFPMPNKANKSRCELWAKFCFPDDEWYSLKFQNKLFTDNKMLCDQHFKSSSFENEKSVANKSETEPESDEEFDNNPDDTIIAVIKKEPGEDNTENVIKTRSQRLKRSNIGKESCKTPQKITKKGVPTKITKKCETESESDNEFVNNSDDTKITIKKESTVNTENVIETRSQRLNRSIIGKESCEKPQKITKKGAPKKVPKYKWIVTKGIQIKNASSHNDQGLSQEDEEEARNEYFGYTNIKYKQKNDDCELYGKLLTKKLRTYSVYERNIVMYKIDEILIDHPAGFDTSNHSYVIDPEVTKKTKATLKKTVKKASSTSESVPTTKKISPSKFKKKKKKGLQSQLDDITTSNKKTYTKVPETSTSTSLQSPAKMDTSPIQTEKVSNHQPIKLSSGNLPMKVTSSNPKTPVKAGVKYLPVKVTSSVPNNPVKVTSAIPNQLANIAASLPSHVPLQISIPQTNMSVTQGKFVASGSQPKGKIVILKTKSSRYVPSSQPPILITVPSNHSSLSTQCDMNSLEQLSSIAVSHAENQMCYDTEVIEDDINQVSHEVILGYEDNHF